MSRSMAHTSKKTFQAWEQDFGHKSFALHHCYKELCKYQEWIERVVETTPKRSRLSISVEEDDEVDEEAINRLEGNEITKKKKKRNAYVSKYKKEFVAIIEAKNVLAMNTDKRR